MGNTAIELYYGQFATGSGALWILERETGSCAKFLPEDAAGRIPPEHFDGLEGGEGSPFRTMLDKVKNNCLAPWMPAAVMLRAEERRSLEALTAAFLCTEPSGCRKQECRDRIAESLSSCLLTFCVAKDGDLISGEAPVTVLDDGTAGHSVTLPLTRKISAVFTETEGNNVSGGLLKKVSAEEHAALNAKTAGQGVWLCGASKSVVKKTIG